MPASTHAPRSRRTFSKLEKVLESQMPALTGFQYRTFRHTKRLMDIVGSMIALVVSAPLWPFAALAIKLNSPGGPIFYRLAVP